MQTAQEVELASRAAALAPEVDRLFMAGHRAARPLARSALQPLGVTRPGILIDLRRQLLSPEGCSLEGARAKERYRDPADVAAALQDQVQQGLLEEQADRFLPTAGGYTVLLALTDVLTRGIGTLWAGREGTVREAADLAVRVIERATETLPLERYPAFRAERTGFLPERPSPGDLLWCHLSTLRYLRADAHALAWQETGLSAPEIGVLTLVWKSPEQLTQGLSRAEPFLEALLRRGWVEDRGAPSDSRDRWRLTPAGRAAREAIEERTNRLNGAPQAALSPSQRERFLQLLRRLPSIDDAREE